MMVLVMDHGDGRTSSSLDIDNMYGPATTTTIPRAASMNGKTDLRMTASESIFTVSLLKPSLREDPAARITEQIFLI